MKKNITLFSMLALTNIGYSQSWQGTGYPPCPGPQCVGIGTNFIGTGATNNIPINLGTFGTTRIHINNNTGTTAGFVSIGTNFTAPQSMLHLDNVNTNQTLV